MECASRESEPKDDASTSLSLLIESSSAVGLYIFLLFKICRPFVGHFKKYIINIKNKL